MSKAQRGTTRYSDKIRGTAQNYKCAARFDITNGYVGITTTDPDGTIDRVLLAPSQVRALLLFLRAKGARP